MSKFVLLAVDTSLRFSVWGYQPGKERPFCLYGTMPDLYSAQLRRERLEGLWARNGSRCIFQIVDSGYN